MITQAEIKAYADAKNAVKLAETNFEELHASVLARIKENEAIEAGKYSFSYKTYDKSTTKYKEVVDGALSAIQEALSHKSKLVQEVAKVLLDKVAALLASATTTKTYDKLEPVEETTVAVVKKTKLA